MKAREMRLRLVVRRHALPETRIIFTVSLDEDPSIADLIEQVNGVVPLESDDWGLEDYVAELHDEEGNAFDLLHFQRIVSVLKSDEEVFIRPLLTNDRRQRRLGGRDQITNDGRHLIDGVPFGRPRFKAPRSRPSISIPPLKRRRITHDHDEEVDNDDDDDEDDDLHHKTPAVRFDVPDDESEASDTAWLKQLTGNVEEEGQHDNDDNDEEDDNDSDFAADGEDDDVEEDQSVHSDEDGNDGNSKTSEELLQELRDLQAANELIQDEEPIEEGEEQGQEQEQAPEPAPPAFAGLSAEQRASLTLVDLDRITALRVAFPTASVEECEKTLFDCRRREKTAYRRLIKKHDAKMSFDDMATYFGSLRGGYLQTETFANEDEQSDASGTESVEFIKHYDKHGFPPGSILAGTAATHTAEALRQAGQLVKLPVHTRFDDGLEDSNVLEDERDGATKTKWNGSREGLDIDESSSSDSEAGPEEESSKPAKAPTHGLLDIASGDPDPSDSDSSSEDDEESDSSSGSSDSESDGDVNADEDSDDDDDVSFHEGSDVGRADSDDDKSSSSEDSDDSGSEPESDTGAPLPSNPNSAPASKEAGGPDIPTSPQLLPPAPAPAVPPGQGLTKTQRRNARRRAANKVKRLELQDGADADVIMAHEASGNESALAAKKAALMESLGFTPDVASGSAGASTTSADFAVAPPARSSPEKDPDAWRHKITYRAVECCQEGITLSEPPFPFYQRWDPQQQLKKRFSKRKQRDQKGYYEDNSQGNKKRRTQYPSRGTEEAKDDGLWDASYLSASQYNDSNIVLNYDDEPEVPAQDTTAVHPGQEEDGDDLPPLPTDLSCLPTLGPGEAKSGMVLTWKQMIMSKATNWAPQVFGLTGSVIEVHDDGSLRVLLAKRDRHIDRNEKDYDQDGNRVYDKFEFPGLDDEQEEELELGYRTLDPLDMMETRILQQSPDTAPSASPSSQQDIVVPAELTISADFPQLENGNSKPSSSEESTTLDHEDTVIPASQDCAKTDSQPSGETVVPETNVSNPECVNEPQAPLLVADEEDSMSEDRRREISQLINDAGFRKEVDPSIGEKIHKSPSVSSSSPSRQLEETLKEAASAAPHRDPQRSSFSNPSQEVSQASSNSSMSVDSQPIILEPFHGFSDEVEDPSEDAVEYPTLDLPPSDIGSAHSGRQPDPDFSIDLGNTSPDRLDSVGEQSFPAPCAKTPPAAKEERKTRKVSPAKSDSSTNSFPPLSEIFLTASTQATQASQSSTSQAAISSAIKARKSDVVSDDEYEEAMRKIDEGVSSSDSETELPKLKLKKSPDAARSLLKKPIEKPTTKREIVKEDEVKSSARPRRSTRTTSESFTIPAGSQVVSLISSSPEPELEEKYADDDVDETYEADSLASEQDSPGWREKGRNRRGASMPLSALLSSKRGGEANVPKRLASSQGGKLGRSVPLSRKENKKKTTTRGW